MTSKKPVGSVLKTSKILGLSEWDIVFLGYVTVALYQLFSWMNVPELSFIVIIFAFVGLLIIRISLRPKSVRDFAFTTFKRIRL